METWVCENNIHVHTLKLSDNQYLEICPESGRPDLGWNAYLVSNGEGAALLYGEKTPEDAKIRVATILQQWGSLALIVAFK